MRIPYTLRQYIPQRIVSLFETNPEDAYNTWASQYDKQPDNLMLALDETIFSELLSAIDFNNKIVADIGCGTGRHWEKLYTHKPKKIIGYDVSEGMLRVLKEKYPQAETHKLITNRLEGLRNNSCDIIISTLALAHIKNVADAFTQWTRVLKTGGYIIITDYHPEALAKGGNRTFTHNGKKIAVKNYVHPMEQIQKMLATLDFKIERFVERHIDETVKHYYEKQQAIKTYEKFKETPIIYGVCLIKGDATK